MRDGPIAPVKVPIKEFAAESDEEPPARTSISRAPSSSSLFLQQPSPRQSSNEVAAAPVEEKKKDKFSNLRAQQEQQRRDEEALIRHQEADRQKLLAEIDFLSTPLSKRGSGQNVTEAATMPTRGSAARDDRPASPAARKGGQMPVLNEDELERQFQAALAKARQMLEHRKVCPVS